MGTIMRHASSENGEGVQDARLTGFFVPQRNITGRDEDVLRQASGVAKMIDRSLDWGGDILEEKEIVQYACGAISSLIDIVLTD
jgi:hypothetical protein